MGATLDGNVATAANDQAVFIIQQPDAIRRKAVAGLAFVPGPPSNNGVPFTIPESITLFDPTTGAASNTREIAGGVIQSIWTDDPGAAGVAVEATYEPLSFSAGDILSCTIAANVFTLLINGAPVYTCTGTALAAGGFSYYFA